MPVKRSTTKNTWASHYQNIILELHSTIICHGFNNTGQLDQSAQCYPSDNMPINSVAKNVKIISMR